jgi:hypothetical protein
VIEPTEYKLGEVTFSEEEKTKVLTCGNCENMTFFIAENGAVACEQCRYLMVPAPWDEEYGLL